LTSSVSSQSEGSRKYLIRQSLARIKNVHVTVQNYHWASQITGAMNQLTEKALESFIFFGHFDDIDHGMHTARIHDTSVSIIFLHRAPCNDINKEIESSWIIFAKSAVKLGKKRQAINSLNQYISKSHSSSAKILLDEIRSGKFR